MKKIIFYGFTLLMVGLFFSCSQSAGVSTSNAEPRAISIPGYTQVTSITVGDFIYLRCEGYIEGNRWLDGLTSRNDVKLSLYPGDNLTGTKWEVLKGNNQGAIVLKCCGHLAGNRYLDGLTANNDVWLSPASDHYNYPGTIWKVIPITGGFFAFRCLGSIYNPCLDGRTGTSAVGLSPSWGGRYSGAVWTAWKAN